MGQVSGQGSRVSGHWSGVTGLKVTGLGSRPRIRGHAHGHGSRITGQKAQVKGHGSRVSGQGSVVMIRGHRSEVRGHWSGVKGQSRVTGQGSLVKPFSTIRPYTNPIQPKVCK